jgi:hypothetical protein
LARAKKCAKSNQVKSSPSSIVVRSILTLDRLRKTQLLRKNDDMNHLETPTREEMDNNNNRSASIIDKQQEELATHDAKEDKGKNRHCKKAC